MAATVVHKGGAGDAFETIRYQDLNHDLKIEPIAIPAVETGSSLTVQIIPATKIEPEFQQNAIQTGSDASQTINGDDSDKFFFCPLCGKGKSLCSGVR